jgi:hypothetical protein
LTEGNYKEKEKKRTLGKKKMLHPDRLEPLTWQRNQCVLIK